MTLFYYISSISQFHSFGIPSVLCHIPSVSLAQEMSFLVYLFLYMKFKKSSYNSPEIAIVRHHKGLGGEGLNDRRGPF